jgi:hypothetical protein
MNESELLLAALDYLARGWPVFPLCHPDHRTGWLPRRHPRPCDRPGKRPVCQWRDYQTRLPTEVFLRQWWGYNPGYNIGLALGGVSGLVNIDVDGPEGKELLRKISNGDRPLTLAFGTGSGGVHLLYRLPEGAPCRTMVLPTVGKPLHLQGTGAYTVMPPSLHHSGRRYTWIGGRGPGHVGVALAPAWLLERFASTDRRRDEQVGGGGRRLPTASDDDCRARRARNYLLTCEPAVQGQGGDARTYKVACKLIDLFGLDVDTALSLMLEWNDRCDPPWREEDLRRKLVLADGRRK